ncbi:MaoC/PaaZ C-terminal domain-containing protein [Pollutimonas bauzanensis]|uniref:3-methylfumaryl-CoA hydratase n=1 Tax=Pollutimonas bauzanensis TaxID=658167 RepID=A0A1M5ZXW7_9BURK|nr:MaoC/PaaZ C-terminal domain-containing protein [Pollutimonas bauzanensis]SHI28723.1 3-methylfumaryl-CoA hydratase [Pollutimonas bauzanensis]
MQYDMNEWIGKRQVTEDEISLTLVRRAAAMTDLDPAAFHRGNELPPHWYSMFFTPNARASEIGHDGHPRKGDFLPPVPLPRRMFVGREVEFLRPLIIGAEARKVSEIASITPKSGRSGQLVFLQVKHTIELDGEAAVVERQNVVYREATEPGAAPEASRETPGAAAPAFAWEQALTIDPVQLFRYSALTWNGHRIHYDADYARQQEGYPACVMNGALTLHLLIGAAIGQAGDKRLKRLVARLSSPLFLGDTIRLCGGPLAPAGDMLAMDACAIGPGKRSAATVQLQFSTPGSPA